MRSDGLSASALLRARAVTTKAIHACFNILAVLDRLGDGIVASPSRCEPREPREPREPELRELKTRPGHEIGEACRELVAMAPAFMIFNDVRVEARPGDTVGSIKDQFYAKMTDHRVRW